MGKKGKASSATTGGGKKRGRDGGGNNVSSTSLWSSTDHAIRKAKRQINSTKKTSEEKLIERQRRSAILTRGSKEKRQAGVLRLQIKQIQRKLDKQRQRLERWDDVEEQLRQRKAAAEAERKRLEEKEIMENGGKKKRKGRKGPETWKLRGAARPAWEVYDFDTRYVDPHIKALEEDNAKRKRMRNIIATCKGKFGDIDDGDDGDDGNDGDDDEENTNTAAATPATTTKKKNKKGKTNHGSVPQPACREFLASLMQYGLLSLQAKQFKSARQAFLECMELDSPTHPITPARCHLMRLYLEANRPDSARRLWEKLSPTDPSVWIRYSAVLVEYVSWKLLEEAGSTQATTEQLLVQAVKANIFCAYNLAFAETFQSVMDYTEEIEEAHEGQPLEEAIEYCNSEQMGAWYGTDDALEWLQAEIVKAVHGQSSILTVEDMEWRGPLERIKQEDAEDDADGDGNEQVDKTARDKPRNHESKSETPADHDDDDDDADGNRDDNGHDDDGDVETVDVTMFAGMFETAMEMLEEEGKINKI